MNAIANAVATIGHNSASVGEMIAENPSVIFTDSELVSALFDEVRAEIEAHTPNVETDIGRKAVASLAYGIAKRKTALDAAGKELNEEHRAAINRVDAIRRQVRDGLDALKDEARQPLTEWEDAEKAKEEQLKAVYALFREARLPSNDGQRLAELKSAINDLDIDAELDAERSQALTSIEGNLDRLRQEEADRAELEKLRAERAEAERLEQERLAKEAAEKAEAERLANAEKAAAERAAQEERCKAQEAINKAEAEVKALRDEAEKAAKKQERIAREEAARQADRDHRSKIMAAAKAALMEHGSMPEDQAKSIVLAIAAGSIPNVTMRF
jgi:colicin import membrane protein